MCDPLLSGGGLISADRSSVGPIDVSLLFLFAVVATFCSVADAPAFLAAAVVAPTHQTADRPTFVVAERINPGLRQSNCNQRPFLLMLLLLLLLYCY